jgi:uncharacterized OsmC-like protein
VAVDRVGEAIVRLEHVAAQRPGFGVATTTSVTTLADGLRCRTQEGHASIAADLSRALGGSGSAPTPSALVRAAFGSCMAMSYRLRASRHGVDLGTVTVTVETDGDLGGMLGWSLARPGFTGLRYHVDVTSASPAGDVRRIVDEGDRLSPVLDALTQGVVAERTFAVRAARS